MKIVIESDSKEMADLILFLSCRDWHIDEKIDAIFERVSETPVKVTTF